MSPNKRWSPLPLVARLAKAMRFCSRLIAGVRLPRTMRPVTAKALWSALTEIFPGFATDLPEDEIKPDSTLHSVMRDFTPYFSGGLQLFSEKQIKSLAQLINDAVMVDDDLENAFGTCFLEHLRQVRSYKALAPFLSRRAKDKTHA